MDLQSLLADFPKTAFVEQYFHRLPYSRAETARGLIPLATWDTLMRLIADEAADVMIVRDGQQYSGPRPASQQQAQALNQQGYTILVRHAEQRDPQIAEVGRAFARDLAAAVDVHLYATPPGKHGFSWHYDAEDVFIVQTAGVKEYSLRKNTVHPWPLLETIPRDMAYPREIMPLMRARLHAGDWLYIPCGYWHKADALPTGQTAISLAIGLLSPSALDLYDFLRARLAQSLIWRQRLPVAGTASAADPEQLRDQYRQLLDQLASDLQRTVQDHQLLDAFIEHIQRQAPAF